MSGEYIGPALPPGYKADSPGSSPESSYDPSHPPSSSSPPQSRAESSSKCGPSLPPASGFSERGTVILGPALPPGFRESTNVSVGPPPPDDTGDDDDDVIGPLPAQSIESDDGRRIREQFESRSKAMKNKLTGKNKGGDGLPQREDWMLELPKEFRPSGMGPRKFRTGVVDCGDRSVWTDTPADKLRKSQEKATKKEKKEVQRSERDIELESHVRDHNRVNRPESLMSIHKKRRATTQEELGASADTVKERKPFNRDTDLEIGPALVTPAKRKALMKDSKQSLNSKFTHGTSSFL